MDLEEYARQEILKQFGHRVSYHEKGRSLNKFGRATIANADVWSTIASFQGGLANEEFATSNSVDYVVSSSLADVGTLYTEGQRLDGTDLFFVSQTVTLQGQTPVPLPTSVARGTRLKNTSRNTIASPGVDFVGAISMYDSARTVGVTLGVPNVDESVKVHIAAGEQESQKCATATSGRDYWSIGRVEAALERQVGTPEAELRIQTRPIDGVWTTMLGSITLTRAGLHNYPLPIEPWIHVPPNHDVRMQAKVDLAGTVIHATIFGRLAVIT